MNIGVAILVALVVCYTLVAIDDLFFDVFYWIESGRSRYRSTVISEAELRAEPQARIAMLTAAWHESDVIAHMLRYHDTTIDYEKYDVFVGTYPNDPATQIEVDRVAECMPRVHKVVNPVPGPTTKADNLNALFFAVRARELETGERFDIVMLHDPEDVIHPLELRVANWHFARRPDLHMIQMPIYPLPVRARSFTAGTYLDEFAEFHTKDLLVREWIHGFVPSAGVATSWRRDALERLAADDGRVFSTSSLTEDYDIGLKIRLDGMTASFVRQFVCRDGELTAHAIHPTRADSVTGECAAPERTELIATRAHFPETMRTAIRQRTRWTLGIVFQSWQHWGWVGDLRTRYLLLHDRKGPFSYAVVLVGYVFGVFLFVHRVLRMTAFHAWRPVLPDSSVVRLAIVIGTLLMIHRLFERAIATARIFGIRQGLLSIIRQPWSNVVNMIATLRAARQFIDSIRRGTPMRWDKTQHYVPGIVRQ